MAVIELYPARKETSFERANRLADEHKRAAWAAYEPLPREAFVDDWLIPALVIISVLGDTGTRSTFGRTQLRATGATVARPTEMTATAQAFASSGQGEDSIVVIRLERESGETRKCGRCMRLLPLARFERTKRNVSGYTFYCSKCRQDMGLKRAA